MIKRLFGLLALLSLGCAPASAHDLDGVWINDAGSVAELSVDADGYVTGAYRTELGQPDATSRFDLIGRAQGDVLSFTVSFTEFGSITAWSGQLSEDEDGPFIRTLWLHSRDIADAEEGEDLWRSVTNGFAVFRPLQSEEATADN